MVGFCQLLVEIMAAENLTDATNNQSRLAAPGRLLPSHHIALNRRIRIESQDVRGRPSYVEDLWPDGAWPMALMSCNLWLTC